MYEKCVDCPFHRVIDDPDPYDSWNVDDVAVVCTKVSKVPDLKSKYLADHSEFKCTDVGLRPYQVKNVKAPDWCPESIMQVRDRKIDDIIS